MAALESGVVLRRAVALYELGQLDDAQRLFRRAVALEPTSALTEAMVRPEVARAFREAVRPRGGNRAPLVVRAPGAALSLDGSARGKDVLTSEVEPGEHLVRAVRSGGIARAAWVEVTASGARVEFPVEENSARVALDELAERPTERGLRVLVDTLGLDGVLAIAVGIDAGKPALVGSYLPASGCVRALRSSTAAGELDAAAASLVASLLTEATCHEGARIDEALFSAEAIAHPRAPRPLWVPAETGRSRAVRFLSRPWPWVGLLAAAGVVIGVTWAALSQEPRVEVSFDGSRFR